MDQDEIDFDTLSNRQLLELLESIEKSNKLLKVENLVFSTHFERVNFTLVTESNGPIQDIKPIETNDQDMLAKRTRKQDKKLASELKKLGIEQKLEIINKELEELKDFTDSQKQEWVVSVDNLRAEMECSEITFAELKKEMFEFKRDILQKAVDEKTNKVISEKFLRYFEEKAKSKDGFIEKMRLKNSTLRNQKNKLKIQLKQKEETGEVLHAIDFDQLQIENSQFLNKIEEKNSELAKLKLKTGNILTKLNSLKQKLELMTAETKKSSNEIRSRKELIGKLIKDKDRVFRERDKAKKLKFQLKQQISDYKVPEIQQVIEYVHLQADQRNLQEKVKVLERKLSIQTYETAKAKIELNSVQEKVASEGFLPPL